MYAISFLFLLVAAATLLIGWLFQDGLTLIWVSIGASVAAAIFLLVGVFRRRSLEPATAGAPFGPDEGTEAAQATRVPEPRETRPRAPLPQRRPAKKPAAKKPAAKKPSAKKPAATKPAATKPAAKRAAKRAPAKKPAAKKPAAKKPAAKKPAARKKTSAKSSSSRAQVVAIPERGTFHQTGCRFVKGRRDTERITTATAKRRGYSACGVCKPAA